MIQTRHSAVCVALLLFVVSLSLSCKSQSFDCRKATTAVEKSVCADPRLQQLDTEVAQNYRKALKQVVAEGEKQLVAAQREWVAERNRTCATGANDCLAAKYHERSDALVALLARTSEENPEIDVADPAALFGSWTVSTDTHDAAASQLTPTTAHFPPPGAGLTAKSGELCITNPPQARICSPFGLAIESPRSKHSKQAGAAGSVLVLTYFAGKADFEIEVGPNQDLAASSLACEGGAKNCRRVTLPWHAASPDAAIKIYHLFDTPAE